MVRGLERSKFDVTLTKFFGKLAYYSILIMAVLACLSVFGVQTTSFAAVLAAAGFAIGLAFQGTLSNFSAGVMLLAFRPLFRLTSRIVLFSRSAAPKISASPKSKALQRSTAKLWYKASRTVRSRLLMVRAGPHQLIKHRERWL